MKNTLKFLFVALFMSAMIACGGKTESTETTEEATETPAVEEAPAPDTTATATDTTAAQ